jgi:hypothetical protein
VDLGRIDYHQRRDEYLPQGVPDFTLAPSCRNLPHQTMEADGVGRDQQVSLVGDVFAVDQCEGSQRSYGFIETIAGKRGRQWLTKPLPRLGKQKERDRLRREQGCVDDEWLGGSFAASSMASAKVFATVSPSWYAHGAHRRVAAPARPRSACGTDENIGRATVLAQIMASDDPRRSCGAQGCLGQRPTAVVKAPAC